MGRSHSKPGVGAAADRPSGAGKQPVLSGDAWRFAGVATGQLSADSRDSGGQFGRGQDQEQRLRGYSQLRDFERWQHPYATAFKRVEDRHQDSFRANRQWRIQYRRGTDKGPGYRLQYMHLDRATGKWAI